MKRYWVSADWIEGDEIHLSGDVFKHIHQVCRNDVGAKFELLTEGHRAFFVELHSVERKKGIAKILEERKIPELRKPHIHLAVSLPRFQKLDFIIEKSVELGVMTLHPFVSDFSFVKKIDESLRGKFKRWEKIVIGASQQSGRGDLMKIEPVISLQEKLQFFSRRQNALGVFPFEGECQQGLRDALNHLQGENQEKNIEEVWVFVGSEGGFSAAEVLKFQEFALMPTTLGDQVLRVDTACITLVAILKYHFSLMEGK